MCDVCRADGTPLAVSPREILKKTIEKVEKEGYTFQIDPECEFFLFHEDENGVPTTVTHEKAGYMDISPLDLGENARRDMVMTLEDMGFEIESSHHEKAPGQHEIDFRYAGAMETADRIVTFKTAVRSDVYKRQVLVSLEPKKDEKTGRLSMVPIEGTQKEIPVDLVLIAAGFLGSEGYVAESFGVKLNARTNVETVNGSYRTGKEKIFTAGDMHRGQSLVVWAIAEGREAAKEVDKSLMGYTYE